MTQLQKADGIAASIDALAYIIGFAMIATLLNPDNAQDWSATQKLDFLLERKSIFQVWTLCIYVVFGIAFVVLALAIHERLKERVSALMQVATAFGLIWSGLVIASGMVASVGLDFVATLHAKDAASAVSTWTAIGAVQDGLGSGVEIVGGLWLLLVSVAVLRSAGLPKPLNFVGIAIGAAGLVTIVPSLRDLGAVFGLGQIVWFAWLGIVLWRQRTP